MACDRPDAAEVERARACPRDRGRFGDLALHIRALADLGYALVSQGRLDAGFAHLEEALAAITSGDVQDPFALSTTCCALLSACDRAGDADRASNGCGSSVIWSSLRSGGRPRMLERALPGGAGWGDVHGGGTGPQAEEAVRSALDRGSGATASQRAEAAAVWPSCSSARTPDEAAELLSPIEDEVAAAGPLAQLHLARGDAQLALAVLLRATSILGADVLRRVGLLVLTVEAGLACGQAGAADRAAEQLRSLASLHEAAVVHGSAELADGLLAASAGRQDEAVVHLESARDIFTRTQRPLLNAKACLALAGVVQSDAEAVAAARAAHAIAVRLDVPALRDQSAATLRRPRCQHAAHEHTPRIAGTHAPRVRNPRRAPPRRYQYRDSGTILSLAKDRRAPREPGAHQTGRPHACRSGSARRRSGCTPVGVNHPRRAGRRGSWLPLSSRRPPAAM